MAFIASFYEHDARIVPAREWTGTICRLSGNIPAMSLSIYDVPRKIGTTKLSKNSKVMQACTSPKKTTSLMVSSIWMGWFEANFRPNFTAGLIHFLHEEQRNDRSNKFGPAFVSNIETTWCKERWCSPKLRCNLGFRFLSRATMWCSRRLPVFRGQSC